MVAEPSLDPSSEQPLESQRSDNPHLDIVTYNKNALNNLRRAVVLGQGQFSLILARVNYGHLQQVLLDELDFHLRLDRIALPPTTTRLRDAIVERRVAVEVGAEKQALMVTGLEGIVPEERLASLLKAANLGRDELPKTFDSPVVLWVNDDSLQKLNRFAPDLKSFAATPIRFEYPVGALMTVLKAQADYTFRRILGMGDAISKWDGSGLKDEVKQVRAATRSFDKGLSEKRFSEQEQSEQEQSEQKYFEQKQPEKETFCQAACLRTAEIPFALALLERRVEQRDQSIDNDLLADLLFLQGRNLHCQGDAERSRSYYESGLAHWQQQAVEGELTEPIADAAISVWDKQAILLFHLGLWWRSQATRQRSDAIEAYRQARHYFEACLTLFRQRRPACVEHFILVLAEVLQKLEDWPALKAVVEEGLALHQQDPIRLARDYGYLAEVAIAHYAHSQQLEQLSKAQEFAQKALDISGGELSDGEASNSEASDGIIRYHRGHYWYLLAVSQQYQEQPATALQTLEKARQHTDARYDLPLYRNILDRLWHLYFEHGHYAQAFDIKLAQRRVESLFGLRAFIGAGQIQLLPTPNAGMERFPFVGALDVLNGPDVSLSVPAAVANGLSVGTDYALTSDSLDSPTQQNTARILAAEIKSSGRDQDINALINRISQPRYPIVVIHGQSGVGKSSTISAGLVPRLRKLISEGRTTHPITVKSYSNWKVQIQEQVQACLGNGAIASNAHISTESLTAQLESHTQEKYQQIVLIFDQFEDFFYEHPAIGDRRDLYVFLRDCLEIPYVKVVLALREDFLHYLLEWDRNVDLSIVNNDILSKDVRYYLGNFFPKAAERVIRSLTQAAGFALEDGLITALVDDLAADTGEVRPIELQVVGAQLQRENITTLAAYRQLGRSPKTRLLQNFLDNVIRDCGPENSLVAQSVLFLLSEGDNRPLKSFAEIFSEIEEALSVSGMVHHPRTLKLVLTILVGSGLLFEVPEVSGVRYQLVHEYLASLIQQQPPTALTESGLVEALKTERSRREHSEDQLKAALANQLAAESESRIKAIQAQRAEIRALISGARSLRLSGDGLSALSQALRAARQLSVHMVNPGTVLLKMQVALCLDASLRDIREKNRLCEHSNWVLAVDCNETRIVSASEDATLKLWSLKGDLLRTLTGHQAGVLDVRFSADGKYIASASLDHTIRIWKVDVAAEGGGNAEGYIHALETPAASVTSLSLSPIAPLLAATYSDAYIRVWNYLTGEEIRAWEGHEDWARTVAFSPDGKVLVTGGEDHAVRLWSVTGQSVCAFQSGQGWVRSVAWHPDGKMLASAGDSSILRLWSQAGRKLKTLYGHEDWVRCVAFSPDGTRLASASDDQTIKVWGIEGTIQQTFQQRSSVHSLAWSADSCSIVSGGDDDQVHVWRLAGPPEPMCRAHVGIVWSACWHPKKDWVLSAGGDNTIKLWHASGELLRSMEGHKKGVHSLAWHPQGDSFASASADGTLRLWSDLGEPTGTLVGHAASVWQVCYSPDGTLLASVSSDRTLRLWTSSGDLLNTFSGHTDTIWHVGFSPDGQHLITASEDNTLRLWHVTQGLLQTLQGPAQGHDGGVWCAAFSPGGEYVASGGADGIVRLWTVTHQGQQSQQQQSQQHPEQQQQFQQQPKQQQLYIEQTPIILKGHRDWVRGLSFSDDGEFLASSSDDGTVRLWALSPQPAGQFVGVDDVDQMLPVLAGHDGVVWDVCFDGTGERLATAGADGTLRIWDLQLPALMDKGCAWLDDWLLTQPELNQLICGR
ncbi:MAG: hypothetical protein AB8B99_24120 [Phormidesmis sp.]